jgi:hypothetical protein
MPDHKRGMPQLVIPKAEHVTLTRMSVAAPSPLERGLGVRSLRHEFYIMLPLLWRGLGRGPTIMSKHALSARLPPRKMTGHLNHE